MYEKIVSKDQLCKLKVGDVVIEHPTDDSKVENFDFTNQGESIFMTISEIMEDVFELLIPSDLPDETSFEEVQVVPLYKKASDLIEEGVWWIEH
jgi:hypothetical protein